MTLRWHRRTAPGLLLLLSSVFFVDGHRPSNAQAQATPRGSAPGTANSPAKDSGEHAAIEARISRDSAGRPVLTVRNRTPFLVLLYVRGVRSGWLRGYRTGMIRGLSAGYHKVYAHSRWGNAYWGPRLIWVPGAWTLHR